MRHLVLPPAAAFMLVLGLLWSPFGAASADVPGAARDGVRLFRDSAYAPAADAFRQATIESPDDPRWRYNLGLSQALQGDTADALSNLSGAARMADSMLAADAWYNSGNVHYEIQNYAEALKAYREALLRNPDDPDAKRNLELAMRQFQKQQQEQQKPQPDSSGQGDQKQDRQQQNQDQKKDEEEKQQDQQNPEDQQNSQDQPSPDDEESAQQQSDSTLTREQAERILRALAAEEAKLRDQARRLQAVPAPGGKDW